MKLMQLNCTANWGSTGKIAEGIGLAAINCGWESVIAYGRYCNASQSELCRVGSQWDVWMHYVRHRLFDGEGLGSGRATRRLIEVIREFSPDVIHLHNIHDHWLNYPLLFDFLSITDIPVVWTLHDCWTFTGGCPYFDALRCNGWRSGCAKCKRHGLVMNRSARNFQLKKDLIYKIKSRLTVVPVSQWLFDICKESFLSDVNMKLIHNGIDIEDFVPCTVRAAKPLILGVASPWNERKGLQDMFKLRELLPHDRYDMALVGLTNKQIAALPSGIMGIERTQQVADLARWYSKAWVFVNPTYSDNFPTVNIEALACGTPVVTYMTGGSPEAVDASTGAVVEQGNAAAMAGAVKWVIANWRKCDVNSCRRRAVQEFDSKAQFAKYVDLYGSLLS